MCTDCYQGLLPGSTKDMFSGMCGAYFGPDLAPDVKVKQQGEMVPPYQGYTDRWLQVAGPFAPQDLVAEGVAGEGTKMSSPVEVSFAAFGAGAVVCCCLWGFAVWWKRRLWTRIGESTADA